MHSSAGRLALTILGTILFLQAATLLAASPVAPEAPDPQAAEESAVAPDAVEAAAPLCAETDPAIPELDLDPLEQTGQPCCVSLCEQTCGVGEPCACKRCIVFGCGL